MKHNQFLAACVLAMGLAVTPEVFAADYTVLTTSSVVKTYNSTIIPDEDFSLNDRINAFVTVTGLDKQETLPKIMRVQWYNCGRLVATKDRILENIKYNYKDGNHHAWFWIEGQSIGAGEGTVVTYSDDVKVAVTQFNVRNRDGSKGQCNAAKPNEIT